ncbi:unnamed protein product [Diamesa hyperborea]
MADYRIFICNNVTSGDIFRVESVQNIPEMYRDNFFHFKFYLKYNPHENNVVDSAIIKEKCYLEIIEAMTTDNLWENDTGFYMVDFKTYRPNKYNENINNSSIDSLASDFQIDWNELDRGENRNRDVINDTDDDEDNFFLDDSGYGTPSASSTFILENEDIDHEFSSFSDDENL